MAALLGKAEIEEILPHRDPFLLVDEVVELVPGERVVARKTVTHDDCAGHFPGNPIMPGVKMVEALAQCGAVATDRLDLLVAILWELERGYGAWLRER